VRLAQHGYSIVLTARSESELQESRKFVAEAGGTGATIVADITSADDAARIRDFVRDRFGAVDVLVNNAAYAGTMAPFLKIEAAEFTKAYATNVLGPVLLLQAMLPDMLARRHGYVVNMNSLQGSDPSGSPLQYGVSKAALMRLTDGLAVQLAGSGVIVFDLSPGLVRTAMTSGRPDLDALPETAWAPPEQAADQLVRLVSGRYDGLHGRFVRAADDLDALRARLANDPHGRILRLTSKEIAAPL
jgi:short-subunit dehydrogenase